MQETNKNKKKEDFVKFLSKKYSLDEKILIDTLNNSPKDFWNTLFQIIIKKSEINNSSNSNDKDNMDNIKTELNFNKEEIDTEIENYFSQNPDENKEIFEEYKNGNINLGKNSKIKLDVLSPTSPSTDKKAAPNSNIKLKRMPSPDKRKKSLFINKNKKFNFTIGIAKNRRHQSIITEFHNLNKIDSNSSFKNENSKLSKKNSKSLNKKSKFSNSNKKYKNRKSCFVKIENNCNLEYNNSKKNILPVKNRKSVFIPKNNFKFKLNINNINNDKRKSGNSKGKKIKSLFNKKQSQTIDEENVENKENEKLIIFPNDNNSDNINKNEKINKDNEFIETDNKNIINNINIEENEKNINDNSNDKINFITEINKEKPNKEEKINIKIYKNKNTFFKIYKSKKLKTLSKPKQKPKKYLNNLICHQISITLKAIFTKIVNNKNYIPKNINNSINKTNKNKQKPNKIIKKTPNKEDRKKDNNEIKYKNYKNNDIDNNDDDEEEEEEEKENINNIRNIYSSDSKKYKKSKIEEKNNKSLIKIYNRPIYRIPNNDDFEENTYNMENFNNYLNTTNNYNKDDTIYSSQMTLNMKKAEIKYYKMSKINNSNSKYINQNNRYDIKRLIKEIEIKKRNNQGKGYKTINNNKNKNNNSTNNKNLNKSNKNINKNKPKKKNYLEMYKETIANIMKNDDSIYNDDSELFYIKEDNNKNENMSELKLKINENKNQKNKKTSTIKIRKNLYSSCDNILKNKYKY